MLPFGPMEAFFIPEIRELQRRGHEITIVPMWPRGPVAHVDARGLLSSTIRAPVMSPAIAGRALVECATKPVRSMRAVARCIGTRSSRILAKNALIAPKGLWLAALARRVGADHIHAQWGATTATMGWIAHQMTGIPWSFTVHRWDIAENNLLRPKAHSARFVRAISRRGAAAVTSRVGDDVKVRIIHMGVELSGATVRAPEPGNNLRLVTAANLLTIKGHRYLLEAIAHSATAGVEVTLDLAGGGPLEATLREQVVRLGIQRSAACRARKQCSREALGCCGPPEHHATGRRTGGHSGLSHGSDGERTCRRGDENGRDPGARSTGCRPSRGGEELVRSL
jgi:colanic acid/amylovoran biosynthesis glycosyltransferase